MRERRIKLGKCALGVVSERETFRGLIRCMSNDKVVAKIWRWQWFCLTIGSGIHGFCYIEVLEK